MGPAEVVPAKNVSWRCNILVQCLLQLGEDAGESFEHSSDVRPLLGESCFLALASWVGSFC